MAFISEREKNLYISIAAFEEAIKVAILKKYFIKHAEIQIDLGKAYGMLAEVRDKEKYLVKAINTFEEALNLFTLNNYPDKYALTQYRLGNSHASLAEVRDTENNLHIKRLSISETGKPEGYIDVVMQVETFET